jgi:cytidine deaminase
MDSSVTTLLSKQQIESLITKAIEMKEKAYCPYSKFRVGCSILAKDGRVFTGCNVENASYGLSICAERVGLSKVGRFLYIKHSRCFIIALFCLSLPFLLPQAVSEGCKDFIAVCVATDVIDSNTFPCGACRQWLNEFGSHILVISARPDRSYLLKPLHELLPVAFGPHDLELKRSN